MASTLFLLFFFFIIPSSISAPYPFSISYHIDCGGQINSTDPFGTPWLSDRFYTGGTAGIVSEPLIFNHPQEKNLRFFPLSSGKKNCYIVPDLPSGRYYFRTFTVYDNYDGKSHAPSFDASIEGTLVFSWRSPWSENLARRGAYSDLFAFVTDGQADFCFYSLSTDSPVIGSFQLVQVDPLSYNATAIGEDFILVNYGRFSCGSEQWGPGFSNDTDVFGRSWQADSDFINPYLKQSVRVLSTKESVRGTDQQPNYFPMRLYQTAVTVGGTGVLEYELPVDAKLDYLIWLHFAEIDSSVKKAGQRVFDVFINGDNATRVDIFAKVGSFGAYSWSYTVKNLSSLALTVKLVGVVGSPLLSGLENYALVPRDLSTAPDEVAAMRALKESLRVPGRMGWNGDPCAPTNWDAWEGITCRPNKNATALVIVQIDLGSQGLKGYISDKIVLLTNLVSLNLSSNSLGGSIPPGLGENSLKRLDLSNNQLTESIPDSLASRNLQLVLLNDNLLEGRVPEDIYSIGVHGGAIDLSGNKGLCGVPSLPACPIFWENKRLSKTGKIAIGVSSAFLLCALLAVIYICCIRRRRNDYDFGFPSELVSLAAKRNRYQRQKSLMHLEMESQHAKGLSPFTPLT